MKLQPESSAELKKQSPSSADAREALIQMIERDHQGDRLLQGALPYLRAKEIEQVEDGVVKIGTWTCYLKERRFAGDYISQEQRIFASFSGNFVLEKDGHWKGVLLKQTRND
jgi:hypothetical protein